MCFLLLALLAFWHRVPIAQAVSDAEKTFLAMYFTAEELSVISATRSLQSIARVAENITVVTADDIELMNAHTLADVLDSVPGVTLNNPWQFVSNSSTKIQGPDIRHVKVLLNGIPYNSSGENVTVVGLIPVQDIEKVEIIRGPASSVWGSAMGGVVNVITKGPGTKAVQGQVALDYGTENTGDFRAAISGRSGRFGYSLSGTRLQTDGLTEGFDVDASHLGARLDYTFAERTSVTFTLFHGDTSRGDGNLKEYDLSWSTHSRHLASQLALTSALGRAGRLDLSLWSIRFDDRYHMNQLSDGQELSRTTFLDNRSGAGLTYSVNQAGQAIVLGVDFSTGTYDASIFNEEKPELTQWAVFANDTISLRRLTVIPGMRYDDISTTGGFWSPSLGMTYGLTDSILLRATVAKGFSLPTLNDTSGTSDITTYLANPDLTVEKMWSYQGGFETNVLNVLWLKGSAFRHDVEDVIGAEMVSDPPDYYTRVNSGRQRRLGLDLELKSKPFYRLTLAGSACFLKVRDLETDEDVLDVPRQLYDISLKYDDLQSFRALVKGRYQRQDEPSDYNADFSGLIVDLSLIKKILHRPGISLEAFMNIHNLFNEAQYSVDIYKNPERWVEGGCRVSF